MADLTPDLQVCLSWGSIAESFYSLQSLSVSCFHCIFGLPGPHFPSTCRSKAVLTAHWCVPRPYQRSFLSFRMRSRSSMPSRASSSLDLVVTMSCGLTLQIKNTYWFVLVWTILGHNNLNIQFVCDVSKLYVFVCLEVLRPNQPSGVMSSMGSLPNHTFTEQA